MMDIFKLKKLGYLQVAFCSEQQVLRFLAVRMQRNFT